ncbi:urease accessory protein UreD [Umezawaea sp.]|uniref:urease accessory protein UreD n=1 Tax=Umezawaea sp. TaxID=1955258 RepID=UPI002ED45DC7
MRARARLVVERDADGRNVVRDLRSMAPITLVPHRGRVRSANEPALVHLVSSVTAPLGGDDLELVVEVGEGAHLVLRGVAATLALPGHLPGGSRARVRIEAGPGSAVQYVPEPTVVTQRARHEAELVVELAGSALLRTREVLVLGRAGERPGSLTSSVRVRRDGGPLLAQSLRIGEAELDASAAHLAGSRVVGTEVLCWGEDPTDAISHDWWSLVPLARGGSLVTSLASDAVTAQARLDAALDVHPGWRSRVN